MDNTTINCYFNDYTHDKEIKFKNGLFSVMILSKLVTADEVKIGSLLLLSHNQYFIVDDIEREFISDEIAALYPDDVEDEDIEPKHFTITFIDEADNKIVKVPPIYPISIAFLNQ
jgi:hypothetical protein